MRLVINISDDIYSNVALSKTIRDKYMKDIANAITGGIILPKGHGRLVDAKKLEEWCDLYREMPMKKWRLIFQNEPCVIDADTEVELDES